MSSPVAPSPSATTNSSAAVSRRIPGQRAPPPTFKTVYLPRCPRTDADACIRPSKTDPAVLNAKGEVDFMRPVGKDESTSWLWRSKIGKAVASWMGLPDADTKDYWIDDFPENYTFWIHEKFVSSKGALRYDPYVFGSPHTAKFRSVPEIAPHIYWLYTDKTLNHDNCECIYSPHGKSSKLPPPPKNLEPRPRKLPAPPRAGPSTARPTRTRSDSPARRPRLPTPPPLPQHLVVPEQVGDVQQRRAYRDGEVVWARVRPIGRAARPLPPEEVDPAEYRRFEESEFEIVLWPGIVLDAEMQIRWEELPGPGGYMVPVQSYIYTIRYLGLATTGVLPELALLPWLCHMPPPTSFLPPFLFPRDTHPPPYILPPNPGAPPPLPHLPDLPDMARAMTPYTLAWEIAVGASSTWARTDLLPRPVRVEGAGEGEGEGEEKHFLGVWFGAERLWVGDLVRLLRGLDALSPTISAPLRTATPYPHAICLRITHIWESPAHPCLIAGTLHSLLALASLPAGAPPPPNDPTLPQAPPGCAWAPLGEEGEEIVVPLKEVAGRYYACPIGLDPGGRLEMELNALSPPSKDTVMGPHEWRKGRRAMMEAATAHGRQVLFDLWKQHAKAHGIAFEPAAPPSPLAPAPAPAPVPAPAPATAPASPEPPPAPVPVLGASVPMDMDAEPVPAPPPTGARGPIQIDLSGDEAEDADMLDGSAFEPGTFGALVAARAGSAGTGTVFPTSVQSPSAQSHPQPPQQPQPQPPPQNTLAPPPPPSAQFFPAAHPPLLHFPHPHPYPPLEPPEPAPAPSHPPASITRLSPSPPPPAPERPRQYSSAIPHALGSLPPPPPPQLPRSPSQPMEDDDAGSPGWEALLPLGSGRSAGAREGEISSGDDEEEEEEVDELEGASQ